MADVQSTEREASEGDVSPQQSKKPSERQALEILNRSLELIENHKPKEALAQLKRVTDHYPTSSLAHLLKANAYFDLRQYEKSISSSNAAFRHNIPGQYRGDAFYIRGRAQLAGGVPSMGRADHRRAAEYGFSTGEQLVQRKPILKREESKSIRMPK